MEASELGQAETTAKPRRKRGEGRLWKIGRIWWTQYYARGRQFRESSRSEKVAVAERLLKRRIGEAEAGMAPAPRAARLTYQEMRDALYNDYRINNRKSLTRIKGRLYRIGGNWWAKYRAGGKLVKEDSGTEDRASAERFLAERLQKAGEPVVIWGIQHLDEFFDGFRAIQITTDRIREFINHRQEAGASNAAINRALAALRRMFHLAAQEGKLRDIPHFPMLKEPPARKGFLEYEDYARLRDELPDNLKPVLAMGYYTGMRLGEILRLQWAQVDLLRGWIRLDPGTTKNDEARTIGLKGELAEIVKAQFWNRKRDCPFVFYRDDQPIVTIRKQWVKACKRAELPGLRFHDLRRTGVRNLVRAGVPERVAMAISGHKTRAIFERYNIVSERDLTEAAEKYEAYVQHEKQNGANSGQVAPQAHDAPMPTGQLIN